MPKVYPIVSVIVPFRKAPNGEQTYTMVQERDSGLWNQPGGGVDISDGDYQTAAVREVFEEAGIVVAIDGFVGLYTFQSRRGNRILCASLSGRYLSGELRTNAKDIADVKDMTLTEIKQLNSQGLLRSGRANVQSLEDFLRRGVFSIDEVLHTAGCNNFIP
jgi:8-oxo-dGTP pyrophosphatase MutT (NUDIX family)